VKNTSKKSKECTYEKGIEGMKEEWLTSQPGFVDTHLLAFFLLYSL